MYLTEVLSPTVILNLFDTLTLGYIIGILEVSDKYMDKEYALDFVLSGSRQEIGISPNKAEAIRHARYWLSKGATDMILKLYEEGDLSHQWDYIDGKWVRYE